MRHIGQSRSSRLECELFAYSDSEHVQQIYTGFALLHRRGVLNLRQTIPEDCLRNKTDAGRWLDHRFSNVMVIVNRRTSACYDMHDRNWIDERILAEVDFYFKRSFDPQYVAQLHERHKVIPLGLNYPVLSAEADAFRFRRSAFYAGRARIKAMLKSLQLDRLVRGRSAAERLDHLEAGPDFTAEPRVLFMARAWDTKRIPDLTQQETVEALNHARAECVRRLRKELGGRFFGGLARDEYSAARFKDALLPDDRLSNKRRYIEILKDYPICVATTGLNGSNGWKLGEYVALSKAIVTEPLRYTVPGGFGEPTHYLEFTTPDALVEAATQLIEDGHLRDAMMMNNYRYYHAYLRPDSLVLNSLASIVAEAAARPRSAHDPSAALAVAPLSHDPVS
jgi:hypothetical protein